LNMYCSLFLPVAVIFALVRTVASSATIKIPSVSKEYVRNIQEDDQKKAKGSGPLQFAQPFKVSIDPSSDGTWNESTQTWELTVESKGAKNLNFAFTRFDIPAGCELSIINANPDKTDVPKVEADSTLNNANNGFWTPLMKTDKVTITLKYKDKKKRVNPPKDIHLEYVNVGFRSFGSSGNKSGSCNIDVVCPLSLGWEKEVRSVAAISLGGSLFCSGAMINNMENDGTPYFLTATHCGITSNNAGSLVAYWNYETSVCGGSPDGTLDQYTVGGADFLSSTSQSDATLVRFVNDPDNSHGVTFAGWDNTPSAYQVNGPGVAIHHPSVDEKRISFEYDDMTTTFYIGNTVSPTGTHVRVSDWDEGTTEGGSSGSPLFNGDHRIIGQLHGGYAACGNDSADWYGRISTSWSAAGLGQWLDPIDVLNGGTGGVDTFDPLAVPTISPAPTAEPTSDFPSAAPSECTGGIFSLDLLTDIYAGETSWTLRDLETNEFVNEGDGYSDNTSYQISSCLYGNCYRFTIFDSYGDGICCAYGQGSYSISVNGQEIGSGGDFNSAESLDFCLIDLFATAAPSVSISPSAAPSISISPSAAPSECTGGIFSLDLLTDLFPIETSWSLTDLETNEIIVYGDGDDYVPETLYQISNCLYGDCYKFFIYDEGGDGLDGWWGAPGDYSVSVNGKVIGSGSSFGYRDSVLFCLSDESECDDSPLPLYVNGHSLRCDSLENYCSSEDHGNVVSSHCPFTCGACSEYGCEDSVAPWSAVDDVYTCAELANDLQMRRICIENRSVAVTCAGTCGICG